MFINLSNHNSQTWDSTQLEAAQEYGDIIDIPFPRISPEWNHAQVSRKADEYLNKIIHTAAIATDGVVIHLAGEPVFCYILANALLNRNYTVLTSTTERIVEENGAVKTSTFKFIKFREYTRPKNIARLSSTNTIFHHKVVVGFMIFALLFIEFSLAKIMKNYVFALDHNFTAWGWPYAHHSLNIIAMIITGLFLLIFISGLILKIYKPSSITIRKLITNALGFKWLSLLFVLTFMMQFTWFIDAAYKIFIDAEISLLNLTEIFKMLMSLAAIFMVSMLFPKVSFSNKELKTETRTLLVSTISLSSQRFTPSESGKRPGSQIPSPAPQTINLDLFKKLLKEEIFRSGSTISMGKLGNIEKILIIPSNELFDARFNEDIEQQFKHHEAFIKYRQEADKEIRKIYLSTCLKTIIKQETDKEVDVYFTPSVNYDNFDEFFQTVNKEIDHYENNKTDATAVYISPGTKAATGALSILGIKGSRMVIYAEQKGINKLCSININVFTLEELLNEFWGEHENYEKG